ncbi:MAG: S26 family signal peptidase, partial [Methanobacterium sp.]|nr:S26 family signal peptidase [Methanobacterium sp.]
MSFIKELAIAIPIVVVLAIIGAHLVVVPTGSMTPAINEGDMVIVEKTDVFGLMGEFDP